MKQLNSKIEALTYIRVGNENQITNKNNNKKRKKNKSSKINKDKETR